MINIHRITNHLSKGIVIHLLDFAVVVGITDKRYKLCLRKML